MLLKLHRISPSDVRAVMEQFDALDLDHSGCLDAQDVRLAKARRADQRRRRAQDREASLAAELAAERLPAEREARLASVHHAAVGPSLSSSQAYVQATWPIEPNERPWSVDVDAAI
jgi:hypothetical protein